MDLWKPIADQFCGKTERLQVLQQRNSRSLDPACSEAPSSVHDTTDRVPRFHLATNIHISLVATENCQYLLTCRKVLGLVAR